MALDTGVTTWLMVSALLVMLMTPGVGFFYGGLVRKKNFISMIALSFIVLSLVSIQWILFGYSLAFGPDVGGVIGNLQYPGTGRCERGCRECGIPAACLHGLPALLCGSDDHDRHLRGCGTDQAVLVYRVRACLGDGRILPARPLGMGRRLGTADGHDRLCRGNGGRESVPGLPRFALAMVIGKACGFWRIFARTPQHSHRIARRGPALVRLVRV